MANGLVTQAEQGMPAGAPAAPAAGGAPVPPPAAGAPGEVPVAAPGGAPGDGATPMPPSPGMHPDDIAAGQGMPASAEMQEAYDASMAFAANIVHGEKTSDKIITILKRARESGGADAVGQVVSLVMAELEGQWEGQMPEEVILPVADEVSDLVLELAEESGAFKVSEELAVKAKGQVVKTLVDTYGVDPQALQGISGGITGEEIENFAGAFGATPVSGPKAGV